MSIAKLCQRIIASTPLLPTAEGELGPKPKKVRVSRCRFHGQIVIDVEDFPFSNPLPEWFAEYERITKRVYQREGYEETICEAWRKASAFKQWWDKQTPRPDDGLSWNILNWDGHQLYAPHRGLYLRRDAVALFAQNSAYARRVDKGGLMGVRKTGNVKYPYLCRVWDGVAGRYTQPRFASIREAHYAWLAGQAQELLAIIEREDREKQREALMVRYRRLMDTVENRKEPLSWL